MSEYVPPVHQADGFTRPPETWTLTLNRYERDNLLNLLQCVMENDDRRAAQFNTGDWVGEIRWMLGKKHHSGSGIGVPASFDIDDDDHPNPIHTL